MARHTGKKCAFVLSVYSAVWVKLYFEPWTQPVMAFLAFPFVLVALIGVYAAFSVIKGVITFNRSQTALDELKKVPPDFMQIHNVQDLKTAQVSLKRAGFDFEKYKIPTS